MQFCPMCGNILMVDGSKETSFVNQLYCTTCTFKMNVTRNIVYKVKTKQKKIDDIMEDIEWGGKTEG